MLLDENFDADEILRDVDEKYSDLDDVVSDDMRELNFGNTFCDNDNFNDMANDLNTTEDMWE